MKAHPDSPTSVNSRTWWQQIRYEAADVKSVEHVINDAAGADRRLTRRHLIPLGLAIIIGSGAYNQIGARVGEVGTAYTALALALAALACFGAALCFAEMASTVPVGGSAYTYSYASSGRSRAWLVGWLLLLQYSVGAGVIVSDWVRYVWVVVSPLFQLVPDTVPDGFTLTAGGLLIAVIAGALHILARRQTAGVQSESAHRRFTVAVAAIGVMVAVKVAALVLVIVVGLYLALIAAPSAGSSTHTPGAAADIPPNPIFLAFGIVYFAFIGFDAVTTAAEETRYPQRDLWRGILSALLIAAVLYFALLGATSLLAERTGRTGDLLALTVGNAGWLVAVVQFGALTGLPAGVAILIYGQSRIFLAIRRDGLRRRGGEGGRHQAPPSMRFECLVAGVAVLVGTAVTLIDRDAVTRLVNLATASAFAVVAVSTVILRRRRPDLPRTFRVPLLGLVAAFTIASSVVLLWSSPGEVPWLLGWLLLGALVQVFVLGGRPYLRAREARSESVTTP